MTNTRSPYYSSKIRRGQDQYQATVLQLQGRPDSAPHSCRARAALASPDYISVITAMANVDSEGRLRHFK
uniref:Uncharacterized protein n=1 Tax=Timema bartmani TaxID=61472 RepID=A0A7R9I5W7_9NEOP|nr:unnamed protein product [Timema bartmani]